MKNHKYAFTMIELVFVIVILGILAAVAIPRMSATRTDAEISKGRADIASIRTSIVTERQTRLITGSSAWITKLSEDTATLFDGNGTSNLLMYGISAEAGSGHWQSTDGLNYTYTIGTTVVPFVYTPVDGKFTCTVGTTAIGEMCKNLVN